MNARRLLTALGTGVTTALLVGVGLTALLEGPIEFSAVIGLPFGILVGVVAFAGTLTALDRFDSSLGRALGAYAAFGYAVFGCMVLRYVNVAGARRTLGLPQIVGVALVAAVVVLVGLWLTDREDVGLR